MKNNSSAKHVTVEEEFRQAMAASGIVTNDKIIADGKLRRVHRDIDEPGKCSGWYFLTFYGGVPVGSYGCFRRRLKFKWCSRFPNEKKEWLQRMGQQDFSEAL